MAIVWGTLLLIHSIILKVFEVKRWETQKERGFFLGGGEYWELTNSNMYLSGRWVTDLCACMFPCVGVCGCVYAYIGIVS